MEDAISLQDAGCFSLVLESVPHELALYITQRLEIPTIGIGAGAGCDGQVLVTHDLLGLFDRFTPRFAKQYTHLYNQMTAAFQAFKTEVENQAFPAAQHSISMTGDEWEKFLFEIGE